MPYKSGNKWKWGNIERKDKEELRRTVYGIWKKNGSKGSFSKFWKTGRVDEGLPVVNSHIPLKRESSMNPFRIKHKRHPRVSISDIPYEVKNALRRQFNVDFEESREMPEVYVLFTVRSDHPTTGVIRGSITRQQNRTTQRLNSEIPNPFQLKSLLNAYEWNLIEYDPEDVMIDPADGRRKVAAIISPFKDYDDVSDDLDDAVIRSRKNSRDSKYPDEVKVYEDGSDDIEAGEKLYVGVDPLEDSDWDNGRRYLRRADFSGKTRPFEGDMLFDDLVAWRDDNGEVQDGWKPVAYDRLLLAYELEKDGKHALVDLDRIVDDWYVESRSGDGTEIVEKHGSSRDRKARDKYRGDRRRSIRENNEYAPAIEARCNIVVHATDIDDLLRQLSGELAVAKRAVDKNFNAWTEEYRYWNEENGSDVCWTPWEDGDADITIENR